MEGSSQGREEADKTLSLTMLPLFPSTNPAPSCGCSLPPPKYCPGMQTSDSAPSWGSLPSARSRFLWQPLSPSLHSPSPPFPISSSPCLPISSSPHLPISASPEQGFSTAELLHCLDSGFQGVKVFKAKPAINTCHNGQAFSQDASGI